MAIQISGTTVIDNSRNLSNIANASTSATGNTYAIRDASGNIAAANLSGNMQVFTSPGSFSVPPTTTKLKVTVTGGGGNLISPVFGPSGSGGGTGIALITVTGGSSIPVTVGAAARPGGSSTFGSFVTATGGAGAVAGGSASFPAPAPTYEAQLNLVGDSGQPSENDFRSGGASYWGGNTPTVGSYGSGSIMLDKSGNNNFPARDGVVVVEW